MVRKIRNGKGLISFFGNGTIRINPYTLKSRFGAQVELAECDPYELGEEVPKEKIIQYVPKMVLDFANIESLDILIMKLQELRTEMKYEKDELNASTTA